MADRTLEPQNAHKVVRNPDSSETKNNPDYKFSFMVPGNYEESSEDVIEFRTEAAPIVERARKIMQLEISNE